MNTLTVALVDDEPLALRLLKSMLEEFKDLEIVACCRNGREVLQAVFDCAPDLLILDVQMPGMNGFEVVRRLQGDTMPLIVFTTAYDRYALKAFDVHAVDYVLKPLDSRRLQTALERVRQRLQQMHLAQDRNCLGEKDRLLNSIADAGPQGGLSGESALAQSFSHRLAIKDRGTITMVNQQDIEWIDAAGDYMCVHVKGETHVMRSTIKDLQKQLCPDNFKRIHRSTLVNLNCITHIKVLTKGEYFLTLNSGAKVKVSRNYRQPVKEFLDSNHRAQQTASKAS
ncbi:LytTR family DNA-binding domain-containing protein [Microbulbifer sp. 2205BS26-8]|uniref:LytR/AlgR family response regulator transcription factor n=1 Tax=Microbulbifer sp. 2205BS26-8 TaxID=3064386 RepID=UPI00273F064A|nr:LytTR family DNA-binding domain-containing protein [Microbulbifer sp. 2205BS26-8]MDP5209303.1 LytTR family DNA-binding domain-containing protein [Microbulbifer sp. 2205BS26-8]